MQMIQLFLHSCLLSKCHITLALCNGLQILDRHDIITKDILQLDPWDNEWTVVVKQAVMHDSYDVCLVANLNPRGLMSPPVDE